MNKMVLIMSISTAEIASAKGYYKLIYSRPPRSRDWKHAALNSYYGLQHGSIPGVRRTFGQRMRLVPTQHYKEFG